MWWNRIWDDGSRLDSAIEINLKENEMNQSTDAKVDDAVDKLIAALEEALGVKASKPSASAPLFTPEETLAREAVKRHIVDVFEAPGVAIRVAEAIIVLCNSTTDFPANELAFKEVLIEVGIVADLAEITKLEPVDDDNDGVIVGFNESHELMMAITNKNSLAVLLKK